MNRGTSGTIIFKWKNKKMCIFWSLGTCPRIYLIPKLLSEKSGHKLEFIYLPVLKFWLWAFKKQNIMVMDKFALT